MRSWALLFILLTSCQKPADRFAIPCTSTADCPNDQQCVFNNCVGASCESDLQCPYTQTCTNTFCTNLPDDAPRPNITAVLGNDTGGACSQTPGIPCVNDGIVLVGTGLAGVTEGVLSSNDTEFPLIKIADREDGIILSLPAGILPGVLYTLLIGNTSGQQAITMQFIQGETGPTGAACAANAEDLVTLLNSAEAKLTIAALPTGTSTGTVALGNHTHDDSYIRIDAGSATVTALSATNVNVDSATFAAAALGTCSANEAGRIARDDVDDRLWLCNASTWVPLSDAVNAPDGSYDRPARSCWEIHKAHNLKGAALGNATFDPGSVTDGIPSGRRFLRTADGKVYEAYCDMETAGGGWTLVVKLSGQSAELNVADDRWWESPYSPSRYSSAGNGEINTKPSAWTPGFVYSTGNSAHIAPNGPLLADVFALATTDKNVIGPGFAHVPFGDVMIRALSAPSKHLAWSHFAKQTGKDTYLPDPSLGKFPNALTVVRAATRVGTHARISGNLNQLAQTSDLSAYQNECFAADSRAVTQYGFFLSDDLANYATSTVNINGINIPAGHAMGIVGAGILNRTVWNGWNLVGACQTNFGFGGHYTKFEGTCSGNDVNCYNINGHRWDNGNNNLRTYTAHGMFVR